ncbi:MAG: NAD(P)H-dependent oxidoreductase [Deltaproteobacteria bacterium]|nr:NAD(P)H-dependent oxidoreductase [Deltaproteobacteria bacterium]
MDKNISILAFAGSLRKGSFNKSLLRAAAESAPPDAELEIFDLAGIPVFNQDEENILPEKVREFKAKLRAADAVLIATPEYNYSLPGVLKNAIDYATRPSGDNSFAKKPVAIMGASNGMLGTARAQYHLRQVLVSLDMYPLNRPEVMVTFAESKIDQNGVLTDPKTREMIGRLLVNLLAWTRKLQKDKTGDA